MSKLPRVLIFGSTGQLGRELKRSFSGNGEVLSIGRDVVNFAVEDQLRVVIRNASPDLIINAAAYTAVDRAESEPDLAMAVNGRAPGVLAEEASRRGILLVHYSTDYVFDGTMTGEWKETDAPNPLSVYGASKLAGERAIMRAGGKYLIFRTSWVYGPHGNNFMLTMLRLGRERDHLRIVDDQFGAPTTSLELADATSSVVNGIVEGRFGGAESWAGIYHMSCGGRVSWCGFAQAIFERARAMSGKVPEVSPIQTSEYPTAAKRPANSVLANEKLFSLFGIRLPYWEEAMNRVFLALGK